MKKAISQHALLLVVLVMIGLLLAVLAQHHRSQQSGSKDALARILRDGKLRVITDNSANTYYLYRGQPMGFEYDLARSFADFLDVDLEVVSPGWNSMFHYLETGRGDLIAAGLTITPGRRKHFRFSNPYMDVQQKLVYRKGTEGIVSLADLAGKTIHVRRNTSYHDRLTALKNKGLSLNIAVVDNAPTEELIRQVSEQEIQYTVADSNIALLNRRYYPDVVIGQAIQDKEPVAWAVNRKEKRLMSRINHFFYQIMESGEFDTLFDKYYGNVEYFDLKKFHERVESRLPRYKEMIVRQAEAHGFDWRIIAAIVYQESHFNPKAKSFTGVRGLMQVTRTTAKEMGITNRRDPEQSLKAGVGYLARLRDRFDHIEDPHQRLLFAMGSYNVGFGHILDAQQLARERNLNPFKWSSMEETLPLLSKRQYYRKTRYGYARGWEPVRHVQQILIYHDILKNMPAQETLDDALDEDVAEDLSGDAVEKAI